MKIAPKVLLVDWSRYSFPAALAVTDPWLAEPHQEVLLQLPGAEVDTHDRVVEHGELLARDVTRAILVDFVE